MFMLYVKFLDEVFGRENGVAIIYFRKKTMPLGGKFLEQMGDYLLWYSKDKTRCIEKFRRIRVPMDVAGDFHWNLYETPDGNRIKLTDAQLEAGAVVPTDVWCVQVSFDVASDVQRSGSLRSAV